MKSDTNASRQVIRLSLGRENLLSGRKQCTEASFNPHEPLIKLFAGQYPERINVTTTQSRGVYDATPSGFCRAKNVGQQEGGLVCSP